MTETQPRVPAQVSSSEPAQPHDVFVSYSRADRDSVVTLVAGLDARGLRAWVDLEDIPPSAEWMGEIRAAIEAADGYLVVVSPSLAGSEVCAEELEHARSTGKRIVPVAICPTDPESVPTFLAELNWIDAIDSTSLERACDAIVEALETDLDHVKAHTRLTVKASEWRAKGEDGSLLLRGRDLEGAEDTLASADREPRPTELQTRFVLASRKASGRRQRTGIAIAVCVAFVAASLGLAAWIQRGAAVRNEDEAVARAAESRSRELASAAIDQLETDPELSLLLASEALKVEQTPEAVESMRQSIDESRVRSSFTEHDGPVSVVRYSPDGDRLLTASYDGTARIQDLASGTDPLVLAGHTDLIAAASFSSDGSLVLTTSYDGTAKVWETDTGREVATFLGNGGGIFDAELTPDGETVITGDGDGNVLAWDAKTGDRLATLGTHDRPVYDVSVGPDGALATSASDDDTAKVWDLRRENLAHTLKGHTDGLYIARFSPDARRIVTGGEDATVRLWDARSGRLLREVGGMNGAVVDALFSPDGRSIGVASEDGTARIVDGRNGRMVVLRGHQGGLNTIAFSVDGSQVVTTGEDGTVRVWDSDSGSALAVLRGHDDGVLDARFSPDGRFVASGGQDGTTRIWEPSSGRTVLETKVFWMTQSPDGTQVAVVTMGGRVIVIDAESGDELINVDAGQLQIGAAVSPDGSLVTSAGFDGVAHVWDIESGEQIEELVGHRPGFTVPVPVPVGDRALTFSDDGTARLWDPVTGRETASFEHGSTDSGGIWDASLSADALNVVTAGGGDGVVRMWDAASAEERWSIEDLWSGTVGMSVNFSPDAGLLAIVSGQTRIVDVDDGSVVASLDAPDLIQNARFSPDGRMVVTRSDDGPVRVWDARTGRVLSTMPSEESSVDARFSHDGRWVVAAEDGGSTRIWNPVSGGLVASLDAAHSATKAFFVAGDRTIVSNDANGVRIDRCDACVSVEELLQLAESRTTRGLTAAEGGAFLGTASEHATDDTSRPAGLVDMQGEDIQDGPLPAGAYSATGFAPSLSFSVPEGWIATTDIGWANEGEVQTATSVLLSKADDPAVNIFFVHPKPGRVFDGWKEWDERRNIVPFPDDLAAWVDDHPHLDLRRVEDTTLGGAAGTTINLRVASVQQQNLPPMCSDCLPIMPITVTNQTGPLANDLFVGVSRGDEQRWIEIVTEEGTVLVMIRAESREGLERTLETLRPILRTIEIGR